MVKFNTIMACKKITLSCVVYKNGLGIKVCMFFKNTLLVEWRLTNVYCREVNRLVWNKYNIQII